MGHYSKKDFLIRCLRRIQLGDQKYIDKVMSLETDPCFIHINDKGGINGANKIGYIAKPAGCDGFFAEFRFVMHMAFFAERFGFDLYILMPSECCYSEKNPVNGTTNPFEYYFEQPYKDGGLEQFKNTHSIVDYEPCQAQYLYHILNINDSGYRPTDEYIDALGSLFKKYAVMNSVTKKIVSNGIQKMIGNEKSLGVHVRGADFKRHYKNHPNIVGSDEHLEIAKKAFKEGNYDRVFLATDDLEAIDKFKNVFGNKLYYYEDVIRTDGDETVMKSEVDRDNHHYKLGVEVIRDMYTLSACDGLIAGMSNVSMFARIAKRSEDKIYEYINIIDKGIKNK